MTTCRAQQGSVACVTVIISQPVLLQGTAFVFSPQWSDTAVSRISLSAIMQCHKGQIVPPNLLAGKNHRHDESRFQLYK